MSKRDDGSVFIEAMVAAAIVALSLAAMYRTVEQSAQYNRMIDAKRTAFLIAQSHLASVGSAVPIAEGVTGGMDGDYAWSVRIAPDGNNNASDAGQLWQVTVAVRATSGGNDLAVLQSFALAPAG
jgi:general secretion pathway protein I